MNMPQPATDNCTVKIVRHRGPVGVVLRRGRVSKLTGSDLAAHVILERYRIDEDGNVCLTGPLSVDQLRCAIDVMKAQLDGLLKDAEEARH